MSFKFFYISISILIFGYYNVCVAQINEYDNYQNFYEMSSSEKKAYLDKTKSTNNRQLSQNTSAIDSASEEATCSELGFKKKTESYANCVIELLVRKQSIVQVNPNDPDSATCLKYGYRPGTNEYAMCRQQIDMARQDAQRQVAQSRRQIEAQQDQQSRAAGLALFNLGMGTMATGSLPGYAPTTQVVPQNFNRTYNLPGGRTMNCTTTGTVTNCF